MSKKSIAAVRSLKLALLASLALGTIGAGSDALAATTASASASATIIAPIAVAKTADLSFGKFAPGAGGSVTVSTGGTRSNTGTVLSGGTPAAASFDVTGEPNATYTIDTTGTSTTLTGGGGSDTMAFAVTSNTAGADVTSGTASGGTLDGTGKNTLKIGGTLTVGASQAAGSYSGNIAVAVAYN